MGLWYGWNYVFCWLRSCTYLSCILLNIKNEFFIRTDEYVSTKQTNDNSMPDSITGYKKAHKDEEPPSTPLNKVSVQLNLWRILFNF